MKMIWKIYRLKPDKPYFQIRSGVSFLNFDDSERGSSGWIFYLDDHVVGWLSREQHNIINYEEFADEFGELEE